MHRVTEERTHRECGWKHGEGHGVVALDRKEPPRRLDKQCLLMEVRMYGVLRSSSIIMAGAPTTSKGCGLLNNLSVMHSGYLNGPLALGMLGV
jgi:hypothetical protein